MADELNEIIEACWFVVEQNHSRLRASKTILERGRDRIRATELMVQAFALRREAADLLDAANENAELAGDLDAEQPDECYALNTLACQSNEYRNRVRLLHERARALQAEAQDLRTRGTGIVRDEEISSLLGSIL